MKIWHLRNKDINRRQWDQTIRRASNGNLYGWSWYLDTVSPGWEALATKDYSLVMPLPARRKFGIDYLVQPILSQQLGLFSPTSFSPEVVEAFIEAIPERYRLIEITLNHHNHHLPGKGILRDHTTYRLDLVLPYPKMKEEYHTNTRRNIDKAGENLLVFETGVDSVEFFDLLRQDQSPGSRILFSKRNLETFTNLVLTLRYRQGGTIYGIRYRGGNLMAAVLMGVSHQTFYYLAPAMSEEGKQIRAMFVLIDRFIETHAGSARVLDFEGSDIEGVARFYRGFGARPQTYYSWRLNRLPFPLKQVIDLRS